MKERISGIKLLLIAETIVLLIVGVLCIRNALFEPKPLDKNTNQMADEPEETETEQIEKSQEEETTDQQENTMPEQTAFSEEVQTALSGMSIEEKVAQLFLTTPEALTENSVVTVAGAGTREALQVYPVAGIIYARQNFLANAQSQALLNGAQTYMQNLQKPFLFMGIREEIDENTTQLLMANDFEASNLLNALRGQNITDTESVSLLEKSEGQFYDYQGIHITDDLSQMEENTLYDAILNAVSNHSAMLYCTQNFRSIYSIALQAATENTITAKQIDQVVGSILTIKQQFPELLLPEQADGQGAEPPENTDNPESAEQPENAQAAGAENSVSENQ